MEKITKIQEVSSFIMNFESKNWNEIVLRLTLIGIRYITNCCKNFKWRMEDILTICDQLKPNKTAFINNCKAIINNKQKNDKNYNYNYNYSNKTICKKITKNKSKTKKTNNKTNYKSKSILNKKTINNNYNYYNNNINNSELNVNSVLHRNKSMILLSGRESSFDNFMSKHRKIFGKIKDMKQNKIDKYIVKKECNNINNKYYDGKNKKYNYRNKLLSLNKECQSNNDMDINVIVSDFPFKMNNNTNNNSSNSIIHRNKNNQNYNYEQRSMCDSNRDYIKMDLNNNFISNEVSNNCNNCNNSVILTKTYSSKLYDDNNYNCLCNEVNQHNTITNEAKDFISELRKVSKSKDKLINDDKKRMSGTLPKSLTYNVIPSLLIEENNKSITQNNQNNCNKNEEEKIFNNMNNVNNINNLNNMNNMNNMNNINNSGVDTINNDLNIISKTVNLNYDIKNTKDNIDVNVNLDYKQDFYINNNNNNNIDNLNDNKNISNNNSNKYLKNLNYKNKKLRSNSIDDFNKKTNDNAYYSLSDKENINNNTIFNYNNNNNNNNDNDMMANTARYCYNFIYESKPQANNDNINL